MRIAVVGGGARLRRLWKHRHPADDVRLFEHYAADATFGFGGVLSQRALEFLRVGSVAIMFAGRGEPNMSDGPATRPSG